MLLCFHFSWCYCVLIHMRFHFWYVSSCHAFHCFLQCLFKRANDYWVSLSSNNAHSLFRLISCFHLYVLSLSFNLLRTAYCHQEVQHAGGRSYNTLPHKRYSIEQAEWLYLLVKASVLHQVDGAVVSQSSCDVCQS